MVMSSHHASRSLLSACRLARSTPSKTFSGSMSSAFSAGDSVTWQAPTLPAAGLRCVHSPTSQTVCDVVFLNALRSFSVMLWFISGSLLDCLVSGCYYMASLMYFLECHYMVSWLYFLALACYYLALWLNSPSSGCPCLASLSYYLVPSEIYLVVIMYFTAVCILQFRPLDFRGEYHCCHCIRSTIGVNSVSEYYLSPVILQTLSKFKQ